MKYLISFFLCALAVQLSSCSHRISSYDIKLEGDSGYISKKDGLELLEWTRMAKIKDNLLTSMKPTDTLGRYFRSPLTGNYVACILDYSNNGDFETHVLIELTKNWKYKFLLVSKERFIHGNYSCCWSNNFDGFNQVGDYFTFNYCGTGSGFCGTRAYYFQNVVAQKKLMSIPVGLYNSDPESMSYVQLKSTAEWKQDHLQFHYTYEIFDMIDLDSLKADSISFVPNSIDTFSILYQLNGNTWKCEDKRLENLRF